MAGFFTKGVTKIEVGDVGADGGMGTVLAPLGYTSEDSATVGMTDIQTVDLKVEEIDVPIDTAITGGGQLTGEFTVADPNFETFVAVFGGSVTGNVYTPSSKKVTIYKSIVITPQTGVKFSIVRAMITATFVNNLSRSQWLGVQVKWTALQPTKEGIAAYTATKI